MVTDIPHVFDSFTAAGKFALTVLVALSLAVACSGTPGMGGSATTSTPEAMMENSTVSPEVDSEATTLQEGGVFFIRQSSPERKKGPEGWRTAMAALAFGKLAVDENGCLRLGNGGSLLVWPPGSRLSAGDGDIRIFDGEGQLAAKVGDRIEVGGGEVANSPGQRKAYEQARRSLDIPEKCSGPLYIVGAEVRAVR